MEAIIEHCLDDNIINRVRTIQLDLLRKFSQVCEDNHLQYFMDGGTLLGAVRHQGFIPWDDDVDVIMPRADYTKLCKIASEEFEYPYFFQSALTEECFFRAHAQLRNSDTTGFILEDQYKNINKGIFLDIFVLDGIADSNIGRLRQKIRNTFWFKVLSYASDRRYSELSFAKKVIFRVAHFSYSLIPFKKQFSYFENRVLARYSAQKTKMIGDLTLGWRTNVHWQRECFEDYVRLPFENLILRAPIRYHEVLEGQYGDYMKIPNREERDGGAIHRNIIFDPDLGYEEYFEKHKIARGLDKRQ